MQTLDSSRTLARVSGKMPRCPQVKIWAALIEAFARQLVLLMLFLTLESPINEKLRSCDIVDFDREQRNEEESGYDGAATEDLSYVDQRTRRKFLIAKLTI